MPNDTGARAARLKEMRAFLLGFVSLLALGCDSGTLDPLPVRVSVEATPTVGAPGDTISFLVDAQGGRLLGLVMEFGDAETDQRPTGGARTARVTFRHAYRSAGNYVATVTATDAVAGDAQASVTIRIP